MPGAVPPPAWDANQAVLIAAHYQIDFSEYHSQYMAIQQW